MDNKMNKVRKHREKIKGKKLKHEKQPIPISDIRRFIIFLGMNSDRTYISSYWCIEHNTLLNNPVGGNFVDMETIFTDKKSEQNSAKQLVHQTLASLKQFCRLNDISLEEIKIEIACSDVDKHLYKVVKHFER